MAAALHALKGIVLVPGFKVRLPNQGSGTATPAFVKGTGRTPAHLRLRDFIDSLVLVTEATLARERATMTAFSGRLSSSASSVRYFERSSSTRLSCDRSSWIRSELWRTSSYLA